VQKVFCPHQNATFLLFKLERSSNRHFMLKFPGKHAGEVGLVISQKLTELEQKFHFFMFNSQGTRSGYDIWEF